VFLNFFLFGANEDEGLESNILANGLLFLRWYCRLLLFLKMVLQASPVFKDGFAVFNFLSDFLI
jgi:hypothetical protein